MPTYQVFSQAMRAADFVEAAVKPPLIFLYGPSAYLRLKAQKALSARWSKQTEGVVYIHSVADLDEAEAQALIAQRELFMQSALHVLPDISKHLKTWLPKLERQVNGAGLKNAVLLVHTAETLSTDLSRSLSEMQALIIPCFEPNQREMPGLVRGLAQRHGLRLTDDGLDFLGAVAAQDLFKLESEIEKLALIFWDHQAPVGSADISPHCGLVREDLVFKIEDHLMSQRPAEAQWLVDDLLRRGESPGAILGFLAHHCRKSLAIASRLEIGMAQRAIAAEVRVPIGPLTRYVNYMRKPQAIERLKRAQHQCLRADIALKTSKASAELVLAELLATLSCAT